jgi:hypothetical protein
MATFQFKVKETISRTGTLKIEAKDIIEAKEILDDFDYDIDNDVTWIKGDDDWPNDERWENEGVEILDEGVEVKEGGI